MRAPSRATSGYRLRRQQLPARRPRKFPNRRTPRAWNRPALCRCMPAAQFTADLEPLPTADELFEPPEMCQQWMPAPSADPVFSYLQASSAPAVTWPTALTAPAFAPSAAAPFVPWIPWSRSLPDAEAVMAPIRPSARKTPLVLVRQEAVDCAARPFSSCPGAVRSGEISRFRSRAGSRGIVACWPPRLPCWCP